MTAAAGTPPATTAEPRRIGRSSVAAWVLYDLANTAFSLGVVTLYFPQFLKARFGATDAQIGVYDAVAMALIFVSAPVLGAISDQIPRRIPMLAVTTLLCVTCTFVLGVEALPLVVLLFIAANYTFQAGLIVYDSLLPEVSTDETRGRVSGIGVGVGYIGSILAIIAGSLILPEDRDAATPDQWQWVFRAIAVTFLVFAIPAFLFVRERRRVVPSLGPAVVTRAFGDVARTVSRLRGYPGLLRFLLGRAIYADAANTLVFFVAIYATDELGYSIGEASRLAIVSIVCAVLGGLAWGVAVDRFGPRKTLLTVLALWVAVFATTVAIPVLDLPSELLYGVAGAIGIALGGTWASDRPFMARLSPPRYFGQAYGLYAMVGRFAAIVGPLLWGLVADVLGFGRPAAVATLLVLVVVAFLVIRGVSDAPRVWRPEDLPELETAAVA
jgi:UMF1 family MFS transporter